MQNNFIRTDLDKTRNTIKHFVSGEVYLNHYRILILASVIYFTKKFNLKNISELLYKKIISNEIISIIEKDAIKFEEIIFNIKDIFSLDEIKEYILFEDVNNFNFHDSSTTPYGIVEISRRLLDIKENDNILDLCSGYGTFLINSHYRKDKIKYTGIELNYEANNISKIRSYIINEDVRLVLGDALDYSDEVKYDKVFSNYPFNLRRVGFDREKIKIDDKKYEDLITGASSSDWLFNIAAINNLKENGKAVILMSNGGTWNSIDKNIRRLFIEKGLVETIISLPERLFNSTMIPTTLLVLSFNNEKTRIINASKEFTVGRPNNYLSDENINNIVNMTQNDSELSKVISKEDFSKNNYYFAPSRYINNLPIYKNAKKLGDLVKSINRGSQVSARELDKYKTEEITNIKFLQLSNIKNSIISYDEESQYLDSIPENNDKFLLKDKSIVLAKIGNPYFKSSVAEVFDDEIILPNGNIFTIEVDQELIDPYYLQAFLDSEEGQLSLQNIMSGGVMKTISQSKLMEILVPVVDMEEQKKIGTKYASTLDEIRYLERKLNKTIDKSKNIFSKGE